VRVSVIDFVLVRVCFNANDVIHVACLRELDNCIVQTIQMVKLKIFNNKMCPVNFRRTSILLRIT